MPKLISIVLPVYNQADHIGAVVESYEAELASLPAPHELVLASNGCRDDSPEICRKLAERFATVRAVNSVPGGWGLGVKLGLRESRGDLLCYTNSARTDAQTLSLALNEAMSRPDSVVKARRSSGGAWRRLGSMLYNYECRWLLGVRCRDVNGTPKVFPRKFEALLSLCRDDDLIDAEFCMLCGRFGYPIYELPVARSGRHGGRSTTKLRSALRMYSGVVKLARACRTCST